MDMSVTSTKVLTVKTRNGENMPLSLFSNIHIGKKSLAAGKRKTKETVTIKQEALYFKTK